MTNFINDINKALPILHAGGLILYPTDTIWGIGCDATNADAVNKIFKLKKRRDSKSMIVLIGDKKELKNYVQHIPSSLEKIYSGTRPTTIIYNEGINLAKNVLSLDGSIAIRIVMDAFCISLINAFGKPIVSTSANISGFPSPGNFTAIQDEIKKGVDYIVRHRQDDLNLGNPSSILKLRKDGTTDIIR